MLAESTPNFILPNGTILVELVLFLIVLGLTNAFVLKPVQRVLAEREGRIRGAQHASDAAEHEAEGLERERLAVLEAARTEARELLEEATRGAEELRTSARAEGQIEHDRLLAEATEVIDRERASVRGEVLGRMEEMVGEAASRVAGVEIDASRHRELIAAALADSRGTA